MPRRKQNKNSNMYINAIKSSLFAVAVTVAAIMIFALIVKENDLQNADIDVFNQIIKIHGIILAAVLSQKKLYEKHIVTAFLSSILYILICFISFSMIQEEQISLQVLFSDVLLAAGIGAAAGFFISKIGFRHKSAKNT